MDLIENYIKKEELDWHLHLHSSLLNANDIPDDIKCKIEFICQKMNFFYQDDLYTPNPFHPMMVWADGSRSIAVEDLTKDDVSIIKSLIKYTNDPILLGKIYDVLWIIEKNDEEALKSSKIYFEYYLNNRCEKENYQLIAPLKRSLYILCFLKKDNLLKDNIEKLINLKKFKEKDDKRIIMYYIADLIYRNRQSIMSCFVSKFECLLLRDKNADDVSLNFIKILIDYYKSRKDLKRVEQWQLRYADMCEEIEKIQSPHGHEYLSKAIGILDPIKHEERVNELMLMRDESQKKLYDSFHMREVTLENKDVDKNINFVREKVLKTLNGLNSIQQFVYLLKEFNPATKDNIKKQITENKKHGIVADLFSNVVFGEDKTIVYDSSKASKEEKEEFEYANYYKMHNQITYALILQPYIFNNKMDVEIEDLIEEIVGHNLFVPKNRINKVKEDMLNILKRNIRMGLFDLITQFEKGCRNYLIEHKKIYPTIWRGSKFDEISLDGILVKKYKSNKFRDAVIDVLGEDLTLELEYLACRPLSANIRNRYVHDGCVSYDAFSIEEATLAYLLIKAYCLGYDSEINKKDAVK